MSPTAISVAVRDEIQRFESVHPNIYAIHELIDDINILAIQQQLRDHIISIEGLCKHIINVYYINYYNYIIHKYYTKHINYY
ncbi:hypothetical protein HELRODRAFT_73239 [Helobdella robusta]|uniref:Uncharacterized protein n=1 Tax=Helobdella robusta TaxID=6412 RepID=T1G1C0_HELRO|nr:hypothetical protein HELRODRAFT_73239 [Helobdella robusta]ESO09980.1 hypothetical protein HELRODRAFT_73239 [Helobdella robusta]